MSNLYIKKGEEVKKMATNGKPNDGHTGNFQLMKVNIN